MANGPVNNDGFIKITFNPDLFQMIKSSLISSSEIYGILETVDGRTAKVKVKITFAQCTKRGSLITETQSMVSSNPDAEVSIGLMRSVNFMFNEYLLKNCWILAGVISETNTPIVITYFITGDKATYSLKRKRDNLKNFSPVDPSLN